jgi:hypothetical protein
MLGPIKELLGAAPQLGDYRERCERAVMALASSCDLDPQRELERFTWCRSRLEKDKAPAGNDLMEQAAALIGKSGAMAFEFVLSHTGEGVRFGYLTQGQSGQTLGQSLEGLLNGALQMHVESGATGAELLARLFCLAFPGLDTFSCYSPAAQAMILGVVPQGEHTHFKVYFNTRLDTSTPHRQRVENLLSTCGVSDEGLYDLLYAKNPAARFHGLGVDLEGSGRAKIYVHLARDAALHTLQQLADHLGDTNGSLTVAPAEQMLDMLDSEALLDQVELAVALQAGAATTVKVTGFFSARRVKKDDVERVTRYLEFSHHASEPLRTAAKTLSQGVSEPVTQKQPLCGVGLETPIGNRPKINLYLRPVV